MRQHKLFTAIYIAGTAISLALAMALFIAFNVQLAPAYPEYCRDRLIYFQSIICQELNDGIYDKYSGAGEVPDDFIPHIEDIDGIKQFSLGRNIYIENTFVDGTWIDKRFSSKCVDDKFWKIFNFNFIHGAPFTKDELHDAKIIVTASTAKALFACTDVVDRRVSFNQATDQKGVEATIVGVVEDVPDCMTYTTRNIYFTLHTTDTKKSDYKKFKLMGKNVIHIEAKDIASVASIKQEIKERYARYSKEVMQQHNCTVFKYSLDIFSHWQYVFKCKPDDTAWNVFKNYFYVFLALLFIPALNLSGMISSRMKSRLGEIGVRKAYGATNSQILWQVLCENLLLTIIGAFAGLVLSYFFAEVFTEDILSMQQGWRNDNEYSTALLYSPRVFVVTLLLCFVLNIASALLPALFALRKNIVQSLYNKR